MSIFENAQFGDKFRTRDGRMAIYVGYHPIFDFHLLTLCGDTETTRYRNDGGLTEWVEPHVDNRDIVSRILPEKLELDMIDHYTTRLETIAIPIDKITCKRAYAIYRTPWYMGPDGCSHAMREELFNVYTDRDIAEEVVRRIEAF